MSMNDATYAALSQAMLNLLIEIAESLDEEGLLDIELAHHVLTIEFPHGKQLVINRHAPSHQLWLASPLSGGLHFSYDDTEKQWQLKDGTRLDTLIKAELETLLDEEY